MASASEVELAEFRQAVLRSEKVRTLCMIVVLGMFALLGAFRILVPLEGARGVGLVLLGVSLVYLVMEGGMLELVVRAIRDGRPLPRWLDRLQLVLECLFPLGIMWGLMLSLPEHRHLILVAPGYAFLMLLIGVSVLRVDRIATLLTGIVCFSGYMGLVLWVIGSPAVGDATTHPSAMYVNLALMLALATGAAVFTSAQIRSYVSAAVREMQTRREHDRLKRDLEVAGEIQQGLLPPAMPRLEHYDFAAVCRPAEQAGGDYFDWQEIGRQRIVFSVGDVTGHGVGPALVTAACRAYVRAVLGVQPYTVPLLGRINDLLHADMPDGKFITLVLIDLDAESDRFRLLSAGHGPTLVVRAADGDIESFDSQGLPLGLFVDQTIDEPIEGRLEPGDVIVGLSDGFFEWANRSDEAFGLERLHAVVRAHRHESASGILAALEQAVHHFAEGVAQQDDVTGLVIKRLGG
jgi:serine phosphatase RsbU (regulator of sigma subunit)